jgi:hypothetical protein
LEPVAVMILDHQAQARAARPAIIHLLRLLFHHQTFVDLWMLNNVQLHVTFLEKIKCFTYKGVHFDYATHHVLLQVNISTVSGININDIYFQLKIDLRLMLESLLMFSPRTISSDNSPLPLMMMKLL